jgi:hypothetical protein
VVSPSSAPVSTSSVPEEGHAELVASKRLPERYQVHELLGRGGMACVYRATDLAAGRQVALKQLTLDAATRERATAAALFEREFLTLTELRHPQLIEVYDYGLTDGGDPYYTMELLEGGDLRERAPLPYRDVCRLLFDVCSSLALLHSRRLLHRDVTPRNIRCTPDGKAKLIDFGAMSPMSAGGVSIVGTPAFVAPETVHRLGLDARTDLYSLGVTLYHALTGRLPYPARNFAEVLQAWATKVVVPSAFVSDIPPELDDLVMALISIESALRPASAFEVMQRLAGCAGLPGVESDAVSRAYLVTPRLVGRSAALSELNQKLSSARLQSTRGVLIEGASGAGRSRLLDACALEAKTLGFIVLRAAASGAWAPHAVVRALSNHLLAGMPHAETREKLRALSDPALDAAQLRREFRRVLLSISRVQPLLLAVDDVHRIDAPSAALLAELIDKAKRGGLLVALTADSDEPATDALRVLSERCDRLRVPPLSREQTHQLLGSLFGEVANLDHLASEIHQVALGNPRQCIEMAQHLVDRGLIRYVAGTWTLPSRMAAEDMPRSAAQASAARLAGLSQHARFLAEAQALAFHEVFTHADYRALLPDLGWLALETAISQLLSVQALLQDGASYVLANRAWSAALLAELSAHEIELRHRALTRVYPESSAARVHHAFAGGMHEAGLTAMTRMHDEHMKQVDHRQILRQNVSKMMWCCPLAIETALRVGASARAIHELRRWHYAGKITIDEGAHDESARLWMEQLVRDTGLDFFRQESTSAPLGERLGRALQAAQARHLATPEPERVYAVDEALRRLAEYVVYSIAIGGKSQDSTLLRSLPDLLEPFIALAPALDAIWNNAVATCQAQVDCQYDLARDRWRAVLVKLDGLRNEDMAYREATCNAIAYAIGVMEAHMGIPTAKAWADRLDQDPYQRVSALNLRKVVCLERGDTLGADKLRRQAELAALQTGSPQMFKLLLAVELEARIKARDLAGIQTVIEQLKGVAAQHSAWRANLALAEASFQLVRGDYAAAEPKFAACIEMTQLDAAGVSANLAVWVSAHAGLAEALLAVERADESRRVASSALEVCERRRVGSHASDLVRILALAEARLGMPGAAQRLDALIAQQLELGVAGLRLGLSYEARAQLAVWSGDGPAFEHYARLTAREYRHGSGSPLGARYQRLLQQAARFGFRADVSLADFESATAVVASTSITADLLTDLSRAMAGARSVAERARTALELICRSHGASAGHLYLTISEEAEWAVSHGVDAPAPALEAAVRDYVQRTKERTEVLEDMITGDPGESSPSMTTVQIAGQTWQLVAVVHLDPAGETRVVGVAAVASDLAAVPDEARGQLLRAIAQELGRGG